MAEMAQHAADFTVEHKQLFLIEKKQSKIENYFNIHIFYSVSEHNKYKHQNLKWIRLEGNEVDCKNGKEYILAITDPAEVKYVSIAKEIQEISCWNYLETIEKQTLAYIEFHQDNLLKISGSSLSVALALSILQEKLGPYQRVTSPHIKTGDHTDGTKNFKHPQLPSKQKTGDLGMHSQNTSQLPDLIASSAFCSGNDSNYKLTDGSLLENLAISEGGPSSTLPFSNKPPQQTTRAGITEERLNFFRNLAKQIGHEDPDIQDALKIASEDTKPSDFIRLLNNIKDDRMMAEIDDCEYDEDFQGGGNEGDSKSSLPDTYLKLLLNDYEEESKICSIEELKRRNQARQKCLREHTLNGDNGCIKQQLQMQQQQLQQMEFLKQKKTKKKGARSGDQFGSPSPTYQAYPPPSTIPPSSTIPPPLLINSDPNPPSSALYSSQTIPNHYHHNTHNPYSNIEHMPTQPAAPPPLQQPPLQPPLQQPSLQPPLQQPPLQPPLQQPPLQPPLQQPPLQPLLYKGTPPKSSPLSSGSLVKPRNIPAPQTDHRRLLGVGGQTPKPLIERPDPGSPNQITSSPAPNDRLRYIVVDGSNIAMTHGNGKFSCRGIQIVVDYFDNLGHNVMAFVPQHKFCTPNASNNILDQDILYRLKEQGHLAVTPSRKIQKKLINCYDDRFILDLAEREDGIVVSNDQYRDLIEEKPSWREIIEKRLLMYTFVQDNFMLPADPLGRDGPTLEEFLSKTPKDNNSTPKKSCRPPPRQTYSYSTAVAMRPTTQGVQRGPKPTGVLARPLDGGSSSINSYIINSISSSNGGPLRSKEESEILYRELKMVFPEDYQDITLRKVLQHNPAERSLMHLTDKCMQVLF
ncbi:NEDD4-binding protein 1-like [Argonauta hians]